LWLRFAMFDKQCEALCTGTATDLNKWQGDLTFSRLFHQTLSLVDADVVTLGIPLCPAGASSIELSAPDHAMKGFIGYRQNLPDFYEFAHPAKPGLRHQLCQALLFAMQA
tara:strand:+ start:2709 stop:3038 length:330 start_codon:yes stop_codon:yes gene_type:complete